MPCEDQALNPKAIHSPRGVESRPVLWFDGSGEERKQTLLYHHTPTKARKQAHQTSMCQVKLAASGYIRLGTLLLEAHRC